MKSFSINQIKKKPQRSHYIIYAVFFLRILLLGFLYYKYLTTDTEQAPTKGGTLIEGITDPITYLPYVSDDSRDRFYKNLLYKSCASYSISGGVVSYESDICSIVTNDNKSFVVSLQQDYTGKRSDGVPVTIDDIEFTYQDLVQKNVWDLPYLKPYSNIAIQKISNDSISISFPLASTDNMKFFTNFILPKHLVSGKNWDWYTQNFATQPITNGCATLTNSRDHQSLIFDVGNCPNTWIRYYQVKNVTIEKIQDDPGIVDVYIGDGVLPGYNTGKLISNDYVGLFFNMQRGKLNIYGRKNIIALTNKYVYLPENNLGLIKEHFLFDSYPTSVTDKSTITSIGEDATLTDIPPLSEDIDLSTTTGATFTLPELEKSITITAKTPTEIQKVVTSQSKTIKITDSTTSDVSFKITADSLRQGFNRIYLLDGNSEIVAKVDLYFKTNKIIDGSRLIQIVYDSTEPLHTHLAEVLSNIMQAENLQDYFFFNGLPTAQTYTKTLQGKNYDITIQTLSLGIKKDISAIFLTDDPLMNPSMYLNANLAAQVKEYFNSPLQAQYSIYPLITKLYTTDLPFFMIGKEINTLYYRPSIQLPEINIQDESMIRYNLLHDVILVYKPQVTKADILSWRKFINFLERKIIGSTN